MGTKDINKKEELAGEERTHKEEEMNDNQEEIRKGRRGSRKNEE